MNVLRCALCSLLFVIATVALAFAQGTYTQIDYPGAVATDAFGIDAAGDICGYYVDTGNVTHGFILSGGVYTTLDFPGTPTELTGMNDLGQIVGASLGQRVTGFMYDTGTQTFTTLTYPGSEAVVPYGINNSGAIAATATRNGLQLGLRFVAGSYQKIVPTGATHSAVTGISSSGNMVGVVAGSENLSNFVFAHGKYVKVTVPNAPAAIASAISPDGSAIVGRYGVPNSGVESGFIYQHGAVQTLQFPGSTYTVATGINSGGEVVGYFYDTNNLNHSFVWTPTLDGVR